MQKRTRKSESHPTSTSTPSGGCEPPGPEVPPEGLFQQGDSPPVGPAFAPDDSGNGPLMDAALSGQLPGASRPHSPNESPDELLDDFSGDVPVEVGLRPVPSHDMGDGGQPRGSGHDSTVDDGVETVTDCIRVSNVILTDRLRVVEWEDPPDDLECADEEAERIIKQQWTDAAERLRKYRPQKPRNAETLATYYEVIERMVCDEAVIHEYPLARTLSYLLRYLTWLEDNGYEVTEATILSRTNVEAALSELASEYAASTTRSIRACLIDFICCLGGKTTPLGGTVIIPRTDATAPYSDTEIGWLRVWAETLGPSTAFTTGRMSLVLGLGAGGDPGESMNLTTEDIAVTSHGVIVTFPDGRRVTVRREFEELAAETVPLIKPGWVLLPRTRHRTAPLLYQFMNWNADRRAGFLITMRRMRATWVFGHLVEGLPLDVLLASSAMDGTSGLSRYLCHFPTRAPQDISRMLRGEDES